MHVPRFSLTFGMTCISWIFNSGYIFHICHDRRLFSIYWSIECGKSLANGDTSDIVGMGEVRIKLFNGGEMLLADVKHVAMLKKNLISLGTLDKLGYKYRYQGEVVRITNGTLVVIKGLL